MRARFYAITRPFAQQFDGPVHTERTRLGDIHEAKFRFLACSGAPERKICQQYVPSPKDAEEWRWMSSGASIEAILHWRKAPQMPDIRRSDDPPSRGPQRGRKTHGRSKAASLAFLEQRWDAPISELDPHGSSSLERNGRERRGPVTWVLIWVISRPFCRTPPPFRAYC